jgi:hypothetical protein
VQVIHLSGEVMREIRGDAQDEELFTFMASFGRYRGQCAQKQGDRRTIL